jgi:SM-20-related protein
VEEDFEVLIESFIQNKIGISDHFLTDILANHLKDNLLELLNKNQLKAAGIGNDQHHSQNSTIRNDSIYWLDRKNQNEYQNSFLDLIENFVKYLNINCYTGITDYEFHYSLYETGNFYKKHIDQFQSNSSRQFSMISYLNADWLEADGGQLMIHSEGGNQKIDPIQGKMVFFKSDEMEHEVMLTHKRRMSVTGWLKRG